MSSLPQKIARQSTTKVRINWISLPLIFFFLFFFAEIPVFPGHFSLRSVSSTSLTCVAMDQSRDTEWKIKYLCYKPALKKLTITWSRNGTIVGQDCTNTRMPYERTSALWENSFLCVPHDSLLKLSWSVSGPIQGKECLEMRTTGRNRRGYFLCGTSKFKKIGELNYFRSRADLSILKPREERNKSELEEKACESLQNREKYPLNR